VSLQIHVETLILDGVDLPAGEQPHMQASLEAELGRLLAEGGLAPSLAAGGALASLRTSDLSVAPGAGGAQMGRDIARAVYGGIGAGDR
jgi:hypothetical protein